MPHFISECFLTCFYLWSEVFLEIWSCIYWVFFLSFSCHTFFIQLCLVLCLLFIHLCVVSINSRLKLQSSSPVSYVRTGKYIFFLGEFWGPNIQLCTAVVCFSELERYFLTRSFLIHLIAHLCCNLDHVELLLVLELILCYFLCIRR